MTDLSVLHNIRALADGLSSGASSAEDVTQALSDALESSAITPADARQVLESAVGDPALRARVLGQLRLAPVREAAETRLRVVRSEPPPEGVASQEPRTTSDWVDPE